MAETQKPAQKRVPLGSLPAWTDEELDELSAVSAMDIESAKSSVRAVNPTLAAMLEATAAED
jgi:hypothetical protein